MSTERFHKAAREGVLEVLKETTRKDCNDRDEGGMTPTLWAAFEGHIDALRLLVARGGEPDKSDHFGNTALHLAAARGHEYCVKFLVKFGCNIWSLDIDRHSARELAAINGHEKILQFLDLAQSEQELNNRKKSRMLREKAEKDAEKRLKEYVKRQKAAEMKAEKAQRKLTKESSTWKSRTKPSPTFSDIVSTTSKKYSSSSACRKVLGKKAVDDFKIVEIEVDGRKSVRSLSGLRRDSEVMYVGSYETEEQQTPRRTNITDIWNPSQLSKAQSTPDLLVERFRDEEDLKNNYFLRESGSIFDRPGFGSVAFRRPISGTLEQLAIVRNNVRTNGSTNDSTNNSTNGSTTRANRISTNFSTNGQNEEISIGSAGSLARRQSMWDDDALSDEDEIDEEWTPLQRFLVANNLSSIHTILEAEQIDLEALMLLTETDIAALKLPLGPRRKLMNAIANRKKALDASANVMKDSVL